MIDIHTHTVYSDGADTPEELLRHAAQAGLTHLSITDHNSVSAYRDPVMDHWRDLLPGTLIRGVEITCMYEGEIVEVLGYGYALDKLEALLPQLVLPFREKQLREAELIAAAFGRAGVVYDKANITFDPDRGSSRKAFLQELVKTPENLRLLSDPRSAEKSSVFTRQEIYNPASPLYVDESSLYPTLKDGAEAIHACGGIALLAHLYIYAHAPQFRARLRSIVDENALDGLECAHSEFTLEQMVDLENFCRGEGLLMSGGSDYHGARKPDIGLGTGRGQLAVRESCLDAWPERIKNTFLS